MTQYKGYGIQLNNGKWADDPFSEVLPFVRKRKYLAVEHLKKMRLDKQGATVQPVVATVETAHKR